MQQMTTGRIQSRVVAFQTEARWYPPYPGTPREAQDLTPFLSELGAYFRHSDGKTHQ